MNRTVYFAGVALFLVTVAFLVTDSLVWRPRVTEANMRRIRVGMTGAQVEAILGRRCDTDISGWGNGTSHAWIWIGEEGWVWVCVGNDRALNVKWWPGSHNAALLP
jgi:hypothetical protein